MKRMRVVVGGTLFLAVFAFALFAQESKPAPKSKAVEKSKPAPEKKAVEKAKPAAESKAAEKAGPAQDERPTLGSDPGKLSVDELRKGANILQFKDYSNEDPMVLVKKYDGLRITDVMDAMQAIGLQDIGMMDQTIRPLWRDQTDKVAHRIYGVAITYQFLPTNRAPAGQWSYEEFNKWHGEFYQKYSMEAFGRILRPGVVLVIDAEGTADTGFVGSNNALGWKLKGVAGVVTNGSCRDTDEVILERIPMYSKYQGGGTRPGRQEAGSINRPVTVGGVLVRPGDMVVADGDGVVVVPREQAERVAEIAWDIAKGDKKGRQKLYEQMKMEPDATVKE